MSSHPIVYRQMRYLEFLEFLPQPQPQPQNEVVSSIVRQWMINGDVNSEIVLSIGSEYAFH